MKTMSNKNDSPKTPGGISKSLLTPCRRVGLSRNWKRQGPSPFISPLAGNGETSSSKEENIECRKRKKRAVKEKVDVSSDCAVSSNLTTTDGDQTPSRDVEVPCKKSKILINTTNKSQEDLHINTDVAESVNKETDNALFVESVIVKNTDQVSTPVRSKSKNKKTLLKPSSVIRKPISNNLSSQDFNDTELKENISESALSIKNEKETVKTHPKVPNDLAKECIVVIQKKIFKKDLERHLEDCSDKVNATILKKEKPNSQVLFDSDSDNEPLIKKNKHKSKQNSDDEDFIPTTIITKTSSKTNKRPKITPRMPVTETNTNIAKLKEKTEETQSQISLDEDDDFEVNNKRTILIQKTYEKVKKPVKAKSTGSISQKDIDELKARIEVKKKTLLTKAMMEDTKELRDLIKKWQKGCQDALMQLMDLMNSKMSDKKNMDYSEMLEMLKIPPKLVGYDEENDCFNTPDDSNIILANI